MNWPKTFRLWLLMVFIACFTPCNLSALPKPFQDSLRLTEDDMVLPEKGIDFAFTRFYNGQTQFDGPLGIGWGFSFGASLIIDSNAGKIILKDADGLITFFEKTGENEYRTKSNDNEIILIQPDGKIERKIKNAGLQVFGPDGFLERIIDPYAHTFQLIYRDKKLSLILTSSGREIDIQTNELGKITSISEPDGRRVEYQYNDKNELISVKDMSGRITTYSYDDGHNVTEIKYPDDSKREITYKENTRQVIQLKGPGERFIKYEYFNQKGYRATFNSGYQVIYQDDLEKRQRIVSDNEGVKNILKYDEQDRLVETRDALGRVSIFAYDSTGRILEMTDPSGVKTQYVYDSDSSLLLAQKLNGETTHQYEYDNLGNVISLTDQQGQVTKYTYDTHGQLQSEIDTKGRTTYFTYDTFGNLSQKIHSDGGKFIDTYDIYGKLLEEVDGFGNKVSYEYDVAGNLIHEKFSEGDEVTYAYDDRDHRVKETRGDGAFQEFKFDASGNIVQKRNWKGGTALFRYNEANQVIEEVKANGSKTSYDYNLLGLLTRKTDPIGNVTRFEYDSAGRITKRIYPSGNSIEYIYDLSDRMIQKKPSTGKGMQCKYDLRGLLVEIASETSAIVNHYDPQGRLISIEDSSKKIEFQYDTKGNLSQISLGDREKINYMYDELNRLTTIKDLEGHGVRYQYQKDKLDFSIGYSNGIVEEYRFDKSGNLRDVMAQLNHQPLFGFYLVRDESGRLKEKNFLSGASQKFEYDMMGRLIQFYQDDSLWEKYTYDANGNILSMERPRGKVKFTYDKADRLLSDGAMSYQYDQNGNLLKKQWEDVAITFTYDAENKLIKIASTSGNTHRFSYNPDGKRVYVQTNEDKRIFLYHNENIVMELDEQGNVKRIYAHGLGVDNPIFFSERPASGEKEGGMTFFYHQDPLNSVVAISDEKGAITNQYEYGPFGNVIRKKEGVSNPFQYTGREYDEVFGFYYCRARYYDPSLCRFLSEDLLKNDNLYAYVENDPINLNDPFGLASNYRHPQARINQVADQMGFNRPQYTPGMSGSPSAYGAHGVNPRTGLDPNIKVTSRALRVGGPQQVQSTIFHENVHELQRMRNPYGYARAAERGLTPALEREAHMRTYEYAVRNNLAGHVQEHSLEAFQRYGGTQAELESYMSRVGTKFPTPASGASRALGVLGRGVAVVGAAHLGYTAGTYIEENYHVGENMGIRDWEEERRTRNMGVERQEQNTLDDLENHLRNNVEMNNLTLQPGVDPNTLRQQVESNLNNNRKPYEGLTESPDERRAREQREREEAYNRYEVEQSRLAIERRQKEEEFEGKKPQIEGLLSAGRAAESRGLAIPSKVQAALQSARGSEANVNGIVESVKGIQNKVTQVNGLIQAAKTLSTAINGYQISGNDIVSAYGRAKEAKDGACDIANNMSIVTDPLASAELARQRAALARTEASSAKGAGAKAMSISSAAESQLRQIQAFEQQANAIIAEIENARGQLSQLQSLMGGAASAMNGVANAGAEIEASIAEVTSHKNGAIGLLAPYLSLEPAKPLYVQASSLGTNLMGVKVDALLSEGTAVVQRITAKIAESAAIAAVARPDFNVALGPLAEKVQDLRATADTIDLFESKIESEAGSASTCANQATNLAKPRNQNPQGQGPSQGPVEPPPGWSPTGDSVAGPSVPGRDAQTSTFQGATTQIESNNETPPPSQEPPSQGPAPQGPQSSPASQRPPGGQEHPGSTYGGGSASDMM